MIPPQSTNKPEMCTARFLGFTQYNWVTYAVLYPICTVCYVIVRFLVLIRFSCSIFAAPLDCTVDCMLAWNSALVRTSHHWQLIMSDNSNTVIAAKQSPWTTFITGAAPVYTYPPRIVRQCRATLTHLHYICNGHSVIVSGRRLVGRLF